MLLIFAAFNLTGGRQQIVSEDAPQKSFSALTISPSVLGLLLYLQLSGFSPSHSLLPAYKRTTVQLENLLDFGTDVVSLCGELPDGEKFLIELENKSSYLFNSAQELRIIRSAPRSYCRTCAEVPLIISISTVIALCPIS